MKSPELDLLRARESTAASQVSSKRPSGGSPQATPRKKRKKAVSAEKNLNSKPPTIEWSRVIEPLGLGLFYQPGQQTRTVTSVLTLSTELRHPSIQSSLDVLSSVRSLATLREAIPSKDMGETIPTQSPFFLVDRCLSSMMGLLSLALSPSSTQTQRKQASDGLSMILPSIIMESLSMTACASNEASSSPDDRSTLTRNLAESFFDPIIRSFIPVSCSIFLSLLPRIPTTVSGAASSKTSTFIHGNEHRAASNRQCHDIRPSLLATIQRILDSLRFVRPELAPALCLLTSLSATQELRKLWWFASTAGPASSQQVGSIHCNTNRNRTKEEKYAFEKQKMQDLAGHDAAWYLLAVLNLCFDPEVSPVSTASSPLVAQLKVRLSHELTELVRSFCFTDRAERIRAVRTGSGPGPVEEEMVLGVYERAWLNGWLDGPAHPDAGVLPGDREMTADVGGNEDAVEESMVVQEQSVNAN
jgi:hypothetical protein